MNELEYKMQMMDYPIFKMRIEKELFRYKMSLNDLYILLYS